MTRFIQLIRSLSKKSRILCSPYASVISDDYKALKIACNQNNIRLIRARTKERIADSAAFEIPKHIINDIAKYPACIQANSHWAELSKDEQTAQIRRWQPEVVQTAAKYAAQLDSIKPCAVLIFQGYLLHDAILKQLALQRNIKIIAIERTMRTDRLVWESISGITVNRNQAALQYWKHQNNTSIEDAEQSVEKYLSAIKSVKKNKEHQSPTLQYEWQTPSKKILFLGQVYTDASMLYGLEGFKCPIELIGLLLEWVEKNYHSLVIKLHPKEHTGKNPVTLEPYADITHRLISEQHSDLLKRLGKRVFIDNENTYDTYNLIEQSDLVTTANSQAGLEAAIMGKSVAHDRQCFYGGLGFTYDYQDPLDFTLRLDQALKEGPKNLNEAKKFFHIFFENYCIKKTHIDIAKLLNALS
jgi:hypothetical protein